MKPLRIFLVRHGESEGNVDRNIFTKIQDYKIQLTDIGWEEAKISGEIIKNNILKYEKLSPPASQSNVKCFVYCSTFKRSRQTFESMKSNLKFPGFKSYIYHEDPRIREQEWGNYQKHYDSQEVLEEREKYGSFYYRISQGESGADVYDRLSTFLDTLFRDFEKPDYPENVIIVSHGFTIRIFLMRWFHWSPEEFEELVNPKNGQVIEMHWNPLTEKYDLKSQMVRKKPLIG